MSRSPKEPQAGAELKPPVNKAWEGVLLREYRAADLPTLYTLDQACFPPGIAYTPSELQGFLEHPSSFTVVAHRAEAILGFAIVRPQRRKSGAALHLLTIDVAPSARRQGIGGLLMGWVLRQAAGLHARVVTLEVAVDNAPARAFYARFAFVAERVIPGYYPGGLDALRMERVLAEKENLESSSLKV